MNFWISNSCPNLKFLPSISLQNTQRGIRDMLLFILQAEGTVTFPHPVIFKVLGEGEEMGAGGPISFPPCCKAWPSEPLTLPTVSLRVMRVGEEQFL
jgi:hypothetical protein